MNIEIENERLKLLENNYSPLPNYDKRIFFKGWPSVEITPEEIKRWSRKHSRFASTGLRIENGLAAIDFDINDKEAMTEIANRVFEAIPQLGDPNAPLLIRLGKGFKEAWMVRTDEDFGRLHSRAWVRPGESVDDGTHRCEIFGGASPRQFGALRGHTVTDDGTVEIAYRWPERSPLDTRQSELPELTKQQFFEIIDVTERVLADLGWSPVLKSTSGENDAQRVYDLTDEMSFDLNDGQRLSLQQMRDLAHSEPDGGHRCSAAFFEGAEAINRTRCLIGVSRAGNLTIWDSAHGATHCEASLKPRDYAVEINRIGEKLAELKDRRKNKVKTSDNLQTAAAKLIASYAYCAHPVPTIWPLWATSLDAGITPLGMRMRMMPNCEDEVGPKGGMRKVNPFDLFMASEDRIEVAGARMRPDKERPTYEEDGKRWINTYTPPDHQAAGGSPEGGKAFIAQLLPDEGERHWFTQWLAHKIIHPYVPGPAVLMVARQFGTGRGTLGVLVGKLLGADYVTQLPFHMFAGKSYQSQYDDWGAETLMAVVTEASEAGEASRYAAKADTYTHIKSLIEPRAVMRKYVSKKQHFKALSFTSYLIATNDVDALPIPANDRRFAVLSNGEAADPEFWIEINRWMDNPANIAAFHEYLMTYDLEGYSPYEAPPRTEAQIMMAEMGRSAIDRCVDAALLAMPGEVYTLEQVADMAIRIASGDGDIDMADTQHWKRTTKREIMKRSYRVGVPNGINWHPQIEGKRVSAYARTKALADKWKASDWIREELLRNRQQSTLEKVGTVLAFKAK